MLTYRPDIDGLRALAVLAVVAYHLGFDFADGGFVGVDVFFVISGFLITSIIMKDIESDEGFSISRFYERRARRIFPALFAVILASSLAALAILTPLELEEFARSAIAATFFVSNILFRYETGYFDGEADEQPLLHTWSLAVEEQFYIAFPLFLMLVHRFVPNRNIALVALVALVSFVMAVIGIRFSTAAAFYFSPPRAWELMLGALLALGAAPPLRLRMLRELLALFGLAAIVWSVLEFSEATTFPGFAALLPTLGAAALIWSGLGHEKAWVNRALSLRPVVFIGLISYSLYLWHWPILVFYDFTIDHRLTEPERWLLVFASFVLAVFSWRFIEQPFRRGGLLQSRSAVFKASAVGMAALGALGFLFVGTNGLPQRLPPDLRALALEDHIETFSSRYDCVDEPLTPHDPIGLCLLGGDAQDDAKVLIWGDSHAQALAPALEPIAARTEGGMLLASLPGCPHLFDFRRINYERPCHLLNDAIGELIVDQGIEMVILINGWTGILRDRDSEYEGRRSHDRSSRLANVRAALGDTLTTLDEWGVKTVILEPVPPANRSVPPAMVREALLGIEFELGMSQANYQRYFADLFAMLDANADHITARVPVAETLCANEHCSTRIANEPLYFDVSHVNEAGARLLAPGLEQALAPLLAGTLRGGAPGSAGTDITH